MQALSDSGQYAHIKTGLVPRSTSGAESSCTRSRRRSKTSGTGSTNLDWRSFLHNHGLNAVVLGPEFGRQVQAMFERDLAESNPITLQTWQQRGLDLRVKELFAQAWEYWL